MVFGVALGLLGLVSGLLGVTLGLLGVSLGFILGLLGAPRFSPWFQFSLLFLLSDSVLLLEHLVPSSRLDPRLRLDPRSYGAPCLSSRSQTPLQLSEHLVLSSRSQSSSLPSAPAPVVAFASRTLGSPPPLRPILRRSLRPPRRSPRSTRRSPRLNPRSPRRTFRTLRKLSSSFAPDTRSGIQS